MKTLKDSLTEGILGDIETTLSKADYTVDKMVIDEFISENYKSFSGKYTMSKKKNKDGKYELSARGKIYLKDNSPEITNGMFVWKKCNTFSVSNNNHIRNLIGAPREVENLWCHYSYNLDSLEGCPEKITGDCNLRWTGIKTLQGLPESIHNLQCDHCENLVSLEGCPRQINGNCLFNNCTFLRTLEGGPDIVKGNFCVDECANLISLKGSPKECNNYRCCQCSSLKSFEGASEIIHRSFVGSYCNSIETLDVPYMKVGRHFCAECCNLKSLRGCPKYVKEDYVLSHNRTLTSMVGLPEVINRDLYLVKTGINSLEGCPRIVKGLFDIHFAGKQFTKEEIKAVCNAEDIAI